jgi:collagen type I alpha
VWIGHRRMDCRRHARPEAVLPVRIRAHAFGVGLPERDLWLSPEHAVFVDEVLIPIRCLMNGDSIRQEWVAFVSYFHIEVPTHDVLFAEGLPAESFLDTGYRGAFANGGPHREVPDDYAQRVWEAEACAPHITHGPIHARVVERLRGKAGR